MSDNIAEMVRMKVTLGGIYNRLFLSTLIVLLLNACSAINKEHYFAPRLDTFDGTGYVPSAEKVSGYEPTPAPIVQLSGGKQRLILKSRDYRIELEVRNIKSERPLFIGPCVIVPLPVIPVMLFSSKPTADSILIKGSISSFKGDRFTLHDISAAANEQKLSRIEIIEPQVEYTFDGSAYEASDLQAAYNLKKQVLKFKAKVPISLQQLESLDVTLHLIDSKGKDVLVPAVHFRPDSGVKWYVCFM